MKFARFLFLPALMTAFIGSAFGQAPMVDPAMSGMAPPQGAPAMLGADCYPPTYGGQMAPGPVYSDCPPCTGPDPFGQPCQRTSRGYFSADAFLVHRKGSTPRTMATAAGVVQSSTADLNFGMETAPRLTFGYILPNDVAIEGTGFYKDDLDALTDAVGPANLVSPYFAAVSAAGGVLLANSNYTGASEIHTDQSTGIHAYEINLVETGRKFNFISGFRYTELNDVLKVTATEGAAVSQSQVSTSNYLLGGQIGFRARHDWELFGIEAGGKAGYMYNNAKSQTLVRDNNNTEVARYVQRSGNNDSFAGELSARVSYRPLPYLAFTAGYQCYWITELALSQDQLLDPVAQNANSGLFLNAHGDMFYHGPSVGMEARW